MKYDTQIDGEVKQAQPAHEEVPRTVVPPSPPAGPDIDASRLDAGPARLHPAVRDSLGHLLWRAAARVTASLSQVLPPGVDIHGYAALLALDRGRTRSQQDLARVTDLSRTTIAALVPRLVTAGLLERARNPEDRRSYLVTRTPEGARAARAWRRHVDALDAALTREMSPAEHAELSAALRATVAGGLPEDLVPALLDSVGFLVVRAHATLHREFVVTLGPLGIEPRHFGTLKILAASDPMPQAELARFVGVSPVTVVEMVDDLERAGLVERRRDPADRRAHLLQLLPEGHRVADAARALGEQAHERWLRPLGPPERDRLVGLVARFVTAP